MNVSACGGVSTSQETQLCWYRAIQPHHWKTALQSVQTKNTFSRFNGGVNASTRFEVLYLAQDHVVALFEVQALLGFAYGSYLPAPFRHWTIIYVHIVLQSVADLTDVATQTTLDTTAQELTGDWFGYELRKHNFSLNQPTSPAPTQKHGEALYQVPRLEGFRTISAKVPDKRVLVVFPEKLLSGSSVKFVDPATGESHIIEGREL